MGIKIPKFARKRLRELRERIANEHLIEWTLEETYVNLLEYISKEQELVHKPGGYIIITYFEDLKYKDKLAKFIIEQYEPLD